MTPNTWGPVSAMAKHAARTLATIMPVYYVAVDDQD